MQTQFGNWAVALGIDWTMPSDAKEAKATKKKHLEQAQHAKDSFVLMTNSAGQRWLGFHAPVAGKVYAAAVLIAMVKPNAVVYQPLDNGHAWVCAIQDGMPVVRHDQVMPANEARDTAIAWSGFFPNAEMIGDLQGAQDSLGDVFAILDRGLASKTIKKKELTFALLAMSGLPVGKIVMAIGALALSVAAAYGVTWFLDVREAQRKGQLSLEDAARKSMASAQEQARLAAARKAAQAALQAQAELARVAQETRILPSSVWSAMAAVRRTVGLSMYGYQPNRFSCVPEACRVSWTGTGQFTRAVDKLRLPNVERDLNPDLNATSVYQLTLDTAKLPTTSATSGEELQFLIQSTFFAHAKNFKTDAPQAVSVSAPPAANLPPVVVAKVGKWHLQMQGPSAVLDAGAILRMIDRMPMRVVSIKYEPSVNRVEFEGEFVFMEQKG